MPELPELDVIAIKLSAVLGGHEVSKVEVHKHIILYGSTVEQFVRKLSGKVFESARADGKFIILSFSDNIEVVINPMLTGRLRIAKVSRQPAKSDALSVRTDVHSLWYSDRKLMGRVYLVTKGEYSEVAGFAGRGPSPLDSEFSYDIFRHHIRKFRGQIKNVLRNQRFVKGIGNAYADEILLYAGILPFRKRSTLSEEEYVKLYDAMRNVLYRFREVLMARGINEIGQEKRDFLMIHGKKNCMCPLCGNRVSELKANRFITNYCQRCQK